MQDLNKIEDAIALNDTNTVTAILEHIEQEIHDGNTVDLTRSAENSPEEVFLRLNNISEFNDWKKRLLNL